MNGVFHGQCHDDVATRGRRHTHGHPTGTGGPNHPDSDRPHRGGPRQRGGGVGRRPACRAPAGPRPGARPVARGEHRRAAGWPVVHHRRGACPAALGVVLSPVKQPMGRVAGRDPHGGAVGAALARGDPRRATGPHRQRPPLVRAPGRRHPASGGASDAAPLRGDGSGLDPPLLGGAGCRRLLCGHTARGRRAGAPRHPSEADTGDGAPPTPRVRRPSPNHPSPRPRR